MQTAIKFVHRVEEVVSGSAPAALAISRYNQRAVSVLSYVSQFSPPPQQAGLPALDQWAVHKILRMPPNSLSRDLAHSLGVFTQVEPIALESYCAACLCRFASSERVYLHRLANEIKDRVSYSMNIIVYYVFVGCSMEFMLCLPASSGKALLAQMQDSS